MDMDWLDDGTVDADLKEYLIARTMQTVGGLAIIDSDSRYVYINDIYAETMGVDKKSSLGRSIHDIIPNSRMPVVMDSGIPDVGILYRRNNINFIVNRYPIRKEGKVIGVVGLSTFGEYEQIGALQKRIDQLGEELNYYKEKASRQSSAKYNIDNIISGSDQMEKIKTATRRIAPKKSTVLITGESGTGKELFAHAIHALSNRSDKPFIRLNCAAIPETLLESELFGYEKGTFTGALREGKLGEFELANGGTMMMDEIDSLPVALQSKLLRVLQEKEIRRIGGRVSIDIDVRMIFTTNSDLFSLVKSGNFREDLYYRINVLNLHIPPLRERTEDIPLIAEHFIKKYNGELTMNVTGITEEALERLASYSWPGNVRELENCIERAFNYSEGGILDVDHFHLNEPGGITISGDQINDTPSLRKIKIAAEREAVIDALSAAKGNKKKAAEILGIDRSVLYYKIRKYDIQDILTV